MLHDWLSHSILTQASLQAEKEPTKNQLPFCDENRQRVMFMGRELQVGNAPLLAYVYYLITSLNLFDDVYPRNQCFSCLWGESYRCTNNVSHRIFPLFANPYLVSSLDVFINLRSICPFFVVNHIRLSIFTDDSVLHRYICHVPTERSIVG